MLAKMDQGLSEKFGLELGESMELKATELGAKLELDYIIKIIEKFLDVKNNMKGVFIEQLPLEIAIAELCLPKLEFAKHGDFDFQDKQTPVSSPNPVPGPQVVNTSKLVVNSTSTTQTKKLKTSSITQSDKGETIGATDLNKEQIDAKWSEVLAKVKSKNHSLSFILKACQPKSLNDDQLCLAFKYKFHKERIGEINIKQMIETVLQEVYGQLLTIETVVDEKMMVENNQTNVNTATTTANTNNADNVPKTEETIIDNKEATENKKIHNNTDEDMLASVLKTFGGKVV
jgi:hypothetical protein